MKSSSKVLLQMGTVHLSQMNQFFKLDHRPVEFLLIHDQRLKSIPVCRAMMDQFSLKYGVLGGEKIKNLDLFSYHIHRLHRLVGNISPKNLCVVALGGGSIGDFAGFFASVYKRGVNLIHVPSTWLAALDSSHGGKTALNLEGAKNQIGTFYSAVGVMICGSILKSQPEDQRVSAYGELLKMALIQGGDLYTNTLKMKSLTFQKFWHILPKAIEAKYRVVKNDPEEKNGYRQSLNLGHTLGHVFEVFYDLPHGIAVSLGLEVAICFGLQKQLTSSRMAKETLHQLEYHCHLQALKNQLRQKKKITTMMMKRLLQKDKKMNSAQALQFVFVKKPGQICRLPIAIGEILREMKRQGW